ncbi:MAG: class I SAM-dependent RNA methyltransferase [Rhodobacteraceae bacterium]|nr:class I SAM-dependent RNA methyltransferase [Paracoccaceae bacterium]
MLELTITGLGHRGDGLATGPDGPVHVRGALPGEVVRGIVVSGRMEAPVILAPAGGRQAPPCPHFGTCGGCVAQHMGDALALDWKEATVRNALAARGLRPAFLPAHVSPPGTRRRAGFAALRLRGGVVAGFHRAGSHQIVEVPDCRVIAPGLRAALPACRALAAAGATRKGRLSLAVTLSEAGPDIAATGGRDPEGGLLVTLVELAEAHDLARLTWNDMPVATRRPPFQRMGRARVVPPPGGFLQATSEGEAALVAAVRTALGGSRRVADLFAGSGTLSLPLLEDAEVHAVEAEAAALAALDAGWRGAPGLRRLSTEARDLFRRPLTGPELARFDAVVIDPPRAGAEAQARALAAAGPARIAALSCNPASFARDAAILTGQGGYRLEWVQVVDQFRWSPHVELAALFTKP